MASYNNISAWTADQVTDYGSLNVDLGPHALSVAPGNAHVKGMDYDPRWLRTMVFREPDAARPGRKRLTGIVTETDIFKTIAAAWAAETDSNI